MPLMSANDSRPAPSNVVGREFPKIPDDLRVTFCVKAPDAQKVQVAARGADNGLGRGHYDMHRDSAGARTVTMPPVRPGFHYCELAVDRFRCSNPNSKRFFVRASGWLLRNPQSILPLSRRIVLERSKRKHRRRQSFGKPANACYAERKNRFSHFRHSMGSGFRLLHISPCGD